MNTAILDTKFKTLTEVNDPGPFVESDDKAFFIENYIKTIKRTKLVVIAGSIPQGLKAEFYQELITIAEKHELKTVLHCSGNILEELNGTLPYLVNPDMRSSHQLFGAPLDGIEAFISVGKEIISNNKNTEIVLFTHRLENVVAITPTCAYVLRPVDMNIVNMLGYADSYLSGFIHFLEANKSLKECLIFATAAGLTNVESVYKDLKEPELVYSNINRIDVEEIPF